MNATNNSMGQRLANIIARATGAHIDPIMACPNVNAGALEFAADPIEARLVVAALADFHKVTDATMTIDDSDPADVYAVVRIPLATLTARLAKLTQVRA